MGHVTGDQAKTILKFFHSVHIFCILRFAVLLVKAKILIDVLIFHCYTFNSFDINYKEFAA